MNLLFSMSMLPLKALGVLCISKTMGFGKTALPKTLQILALKLAFCNQFENYFLYAPKVEVYTGSNPLVYVLSSAKLSATGQQWVIELADFNLQIHYKSGRNHQDANAVGQFPESIHQYTS